MTQLLPSQLIMMTELLSSGYPNIGGNVGTHIPGLCLNHGQSSERATAVGDLTAEIRLQCTARCGSSDDNGFPK